jgi:RloB-like protein
LNQRDFRSLKRQRTQRDDRVKLIIVCEDKNAAPDYFRALEKHTSNPLIEIDKIDGGAGVPQTIIETSIKHLELQAKEAKQKRVKNINQVWAVFDKDKHTSFESAIQKGEAKGVNIAYVIPCFELWLILHYERYDKHQHHKDMPKICAEKVNCFDKDKKTGDFSKLIKLVETAESHADWLANAREKEGSTYGNPSTTIQHLTRKIRGVKT